MRRLLCLVLMAAVVGLGAVTQADAASHGGTHGGHGGGGPKAVWVPWYESPPVVIFRPLVGAVHTVTGLVTEGIFGLFPAISSAHDHMMPMGKGAHKKR